MTERSRPSYHYVSRPQNPLTVSSQPFYLSPAEALSGGMTRYRDEIALALALPAPV